mmetsp:Transcript_15379/g.42564  ORF Transcript_15379/g.42564 Transcript_15379/m.42564 type:complete len:172 (+) Transcript_15379:768-1283(+)
MIRQHFGPLFRLSRESQDELVEYMRYWDILRRCCGKQMSGKWRNEQFPEAKQAHDYNRTEYLHSPRYHGCAMYDIDRVEDLFLQTPLYQKLVSHPQLEIVARPSQADPPLTGTYCSRYNEAVRTEGLRAMQPLQDDHNNAGLKKVKRLKKLRQQNKEFNTSTISLWRQGFA